jgi:hypothetical protein
VHCFSECYIGENTCKCKYSDFWQNLLFHTFNGILFKCMDRISVEVNQAMYDGTRRDW